MRLPDFLIIGAQKAGTTWLADQLDRHPSIGLPRSELHYFDKTENFRRGPEWYAAHFNAIADLPIVGEKTPDYLWAGGEGTEDHDPHVHRNIHSTVPDAKLVVVLRDPVRRAVSAVNHLVRTGRLSPLANIDRLLSTNAPAIRGHGVLEYGLYHDQLARYLELFPRENLLLLVYEEDVEAEPHHGLRRTCEFLGVDPDFDGYMLTESVNAGQRSRYALALEYYMPFAAGVARLMDATLPLQPAYIRPGERVMRSLGEFYAEANERLFRLLGRRIESWM